MNKCGAICLTPDQSCADYVGGAFKNALDLVVAAAESEENPTGVALAVPAIVGDYAHPQCAAWNGLEYFTY